MQTFEAPPIKALCMFLAVTIICFLFCAVAIYFSLKVLADSKKIKKKLEEENPSVGSD
jgi:large-conductance mechanosensitive channel